MASISVPVTSIGKTVSCGEEAKHLRILAPGADFRAPLLVEALRLRGRVYVAEGYSTPACLTADGQLPLALDNESWHVLLLGANQEVIGHMRYTVETDHWRLPVRGCALTRDPVWGVATQRALQAMCERAAAEKLSFVQVGAWVIAPGARAGANALTLALGAFALGHVLGHCMCASTATVRHHSAEILCRLGGWRFAVDGQELPSFFEPQFQCEMRLLGFDSRRLSKRYESRLCALRRTVEQQLAGERS